MYIIANTSQETYIAMWPTGKALLCRLLGLFQGLVLDLVLDWVLKQLH
jgi:hypothetical protein